MSTGTWRWAAAGGGLALAASFTLPLLGSLTGTRIAGRTGVWWLVPAAALVLVVLGWWRGPVSVRRKAWITGVACGAALGHVVALMVLRRPAGLGVLHGLDIDPAGSVGAGYWVSLAGFLVAAAPRVLVVRARPVLAGVVAGVLLGTVAGSAVLDVRQADARRVVVLLNASASGEAAFSADVAADLEATKPAEARGSVAGDHEDLFGGRWQKPGCERERIASLVAGAPAARSAGWLFAVSRGSSEPVPDNARRYVAGLTPVRLRADVLVTAHGFAGDRAYPYRSVLQAGTAVLVDRRGVPRVRCAGVLPLAPPGEPVPGNDYRGARWERFDPAAIVRITPAPHDVRQFGMTGDSRSFRRPAGTDGGGDVDLVPEQAVVDGTFVLKGKQVECTVTDCTRDAETGISVTVTGCPALCAVSSVRWVGTPHVTEEGGVLTVTGTPTQGFNCAGKPMTPTFSLKLRAKSGQVVAGVWTAREVQGEYANRATGSGCRDAKLTWAVSGARS